MHNNMFFVFAGMCLLAHIIRTIYEVLKFRNVIKATKLSFIIMFANMGMLWGSWFSLCVFDQYKVVLPDFIRYAGLAVTVAGLAMFLTALLTIKSLETYEGNMISHGIYSFIRHPMYLGFIFWLIGFPLFSGSLYSMIPAVVFAANILFWRHLEEIELLERFPGYGEYREKTIF